LLHRVGEVLASDACAVIGGVHEPGHLEHVVEAIGVALLEVATAGTVEALERRG